MQSLPEVISYFGRHGARHDVHEHEGMVGEFVPATPALVAKALRELLSEGVLSPGMHFLDAGSGDGLVVAIAAALGLRAVGVEFNPALVRASRRNLDALARKRAIGRDSWKILEGDFLAGATYAKGRTSFARFSAVFNFHSYEIALAQKIRAESLPGTLFLYYSIYDKPLADARSFLLCSKKVLRARSHDEFLFAYAKSDPAVHSR